MLRINSRINPMLWAADEVAIVFGYERTPLAERVVSGVDADAG
jgi:hypothetical protein